MKVFVRLMGKILKDSDIHEFWFSLNDGASLADLLKIMEEKKGLKIDVEEHPIIFINNLLTNLPEGLNAQLKDLDKIIIMSPAIAGG
ncbi:MAG: hypothetical protein QXX99_07890 [Candidatus Bathyarchaeia archaeon]